MVVQCNNEANKLVQCLHVLRNCQEGANCLNMLKVKADTTGVNGIVQEVQFGFAKVTFGRVYDKPVVR